MAVQARQAAAAVAPGLLAGAAMRSHLWRNVAVFTFAVALVLSLMVVTVQFDGLASYDRHTPGAPLNAADAEQ
jgi:predicted secreted protein